MLKSKSVSQKKVVPVKAKEGVPEIPTRIPKVEAVDGNKLATLMVQLYRGIVPSIEGISALEREAFRRILDEDTEKEMVLTDREKLRRLMREILAG